MNRTSVAAFGLFIAFAPFGGVHAASLIYNGDFESTSVSGTVPDGWTAAGGNPSPPHAYTGDPTVPPSSGVWAVDLGPSGVDAQNGGTLFQTFTVPGAGAYVFSFDYTNEFSNGLHPADFFWSLSGLINDGDTLRNIGGGYNSFVRTYSASSAGSLTVTFGDIIGTHPGGLDAVIDNVSFSATPVPEPSALWLLLTGLFSLAIRARVARNG